MSQDIVADTLNEIMNAKKARKEAVVVKRFSKLLLKVLEIAKEFGYIGNYKFRENEGKKELEISVGSLNECRAIKPRFYVQKNEIEKYMRRFLPSRKMGIIIISTSKGLMTHEETIKKGLGGSLIAYFF